MQSKHTQAQAEAKVKIAEIVGATVVNVAIFITFIAFNFIVLYYMNK